MKIIFYLIGGLFMTKSLLGMNVVHSTKKNCTTKTYTTATGSTTKIVSCNQSNTNNGRPTVTIHHYRQVNIRKK